MRPSIFLSLKSRTRRRQFAQSWMQAPATCRMQCSLVMTRGVPSTMRPSVISPRCGAIRSISARVSSGESHTACAPRAASSRMHGTLCTGMQLRSSTTEPISAPSASSEMVPTAAGAPGVNHGSSRSWSSSRETSSSTGMTPSAEQLAGESPSASRSSTVMYTRAAPALRADAAALSEVTSAQTSPRSFKSAGHTGSLCTIKWFTRSAYGARMARSSALHAAARTLWTAENPIPQPSSSWMSKLTASNGEEPMRPTCSTRSSAETARVLADSTVKPSARPESAGSSMQVSSTVNG